MFISSTNQFLSQKQLETHQKGVKPGIDELSMAPYFGQAINTYRKIFDTLIEVGKLHKVTLLKLV
jgi:hypothetical protein